MENSYSRIFKLLLQETKVNDPKTRKCIKQDCVGVAYKTGRKDRRGFHHYTCPQCAANFSIKPKVSEAPKSSAGPDYWSSQGGVEQAEKDAQKPATQAEIQKLKDKFNPKR